MWWRRLAELQVERHSFRRQPGTVDAPADVEQQQLRLEVGTSGWRHPEAAPHTQPLDHRREACPAAVSSKRVFPADASNATSPASSTGSSPRLIHKLRQHTTLLDKQ